LLVGPELLIALGLLGAGLCWLILAAPLLQDLAGQIRQALRRLLSLERVRVDLAQANLSWLRPPAWLAIRWGTAALAAVVGLWLFGLPVLALVAALAAYHLLGWALESRRRQAEMARQRALLDALRFGIAVMTIAGGAVQMLQALASSGPAAAQPIFRELVAGASGPEATLLEPLEAMRQHLADPLFDDLALSLRLHWQRGGKLVPALEALASDWQESLRLQREAKSLRAGVEATVLVLTILPFAFLLIIHLLAPALLQPLATAVGEVVVALVVAWMVAGYRILQRMSEPPREERLRLSEEPG
jgi:tight adherence protein B